MSSPLQRIFGNKRILSPHPHDVLHIIDYTHHAKGHHQSKGCGGNWTGILSKPEKETRLYLECKERNVGWRGKNEGHSDGSADDTDNKGGNHRHHSLTSQSFRCKVTKKIAKRIAFRYYFTLSLTQLFIIDYAEMGHYLQSKRIFLRLSFGLTAK